MYHVPYLLAALCTFDVPFSILEKCWCMAKPVVLGFPFRIRPEKSRELGAEQVYKKKDALGKSWFENITNIWKVHSVKLTKTLEEDYLAADLNKLLLFSC